MRRLLIAATGIGVSFAVGVAAIEIRRQPPENPYLSLVHAVEDHDVERVRALLEDGVDPNLHRSNRYTPIFSATDPAVVDLLLAHGARIDVRTTSGETPIEHAAWRSTLESEDQPAWAAVVAQLRNAGAEYSIETAIYMNDVEFVREALYYDPSWLHVSSVRWGVAAEPNNPLRLAAWAGHAAMCQLMLDYGADPDAFEEGWGFPILVDAARHTDVIEVLLEHGADVQRRISRTGTWSGPRFVGDQATPLHYVVEYPSADSVSLLIEAGCDLNAQDSFGQTALHIALNRTGSHDEYEDLVMCLLSHGASTQITDINGRTPADVAVECGWPVSVVQRLEDHTYTYSPSMLMQK